MHQAFRKAQIFRVFSTSSGTSRMFTTSSGTPQMFRNISKVPEHLTSSGSCFSSGTVPLEWQKCPANTAKAAKLGPVAPSATPESARATQQTIPQPLRFSVRTSRHHHHRGRTNSERVEDGPKSEVVWLLALLPQHTLISLDDHLVPTQMRSQHYLVIVEYSSIVY
jgi:hypothetical protein